MKKTLKVLIKVLEFLVIIFVVLMSSTILLRNDHNFTEIANKLIVPITKADTFYMDDLNENSLLVINTSKKNIKKGDTIYYYDVEYQKYVVRRAIVQTVVTDEINSVYIVENPTSKTITKTGLIGSTATTYKDVGFLYKLIQTNLGFVLFILLPILLVFSYEIHQLTKLKNEVNKNEKVKEPKKEE